MPQVPVLMPVDAAVDDGSTAILRRVAARDARGRLLEKRAGVEGGSEAHARGRRPVERHAGIRPAASPTTTIAAGDGQGAGR